MVGMAASRKFIIDCDTGVDDAVALLMACNYGKDIEILAVTCVNGNSTVDQAVHNTLLTLGIAKKKVGYAINYFIEIFWYIHIISVNKLVVCAVAVMFTRYQCIVDAVDPSQLMTPPQMESMLLMA